MDINPVLLEDDADFQCQVGATREVNAIRSVDAHLTVTVPPEPPIIYNGAKITTVETRTVEIRCSSRGGKPVAEVRYIINRKFIIFCRQGLKCINYYHGRSNFFICLHSSISKSYSSFLCM